MKFIRKKLSVVLCMLFLSGCSATNATVSDSEVYDSSIITSIMEETATETVISEPTEQEITESEIRANVEEYFNLLKDGKWEESQDYLNVTYDYKRKSIFSVDDVNVLRKHYSLFDVSIEDIEVNDNSAVVKLSIKHPEIQQILDERAATISLGMDSNAPEKAMEELINSDRLRYETDEAYISVKKKKNNWEIVADSYFALAIDYGKTSELTIELMTENEKKKQEMDIYIQSNIEVLDYNIGMCSSYLEEDVPGLTRLAIKNNGSKNIDTLTVRIEFLDETNNIVFTEDMVVISSLLSNPIKSGYSWKMEDDKFFEIEDVPNEINIERANLYIVDVNLSEQNVSANMSPEEEYIRDYIDLTSAKVEMCSSYTKECPGLRDVSVKNRGEKNIETLTVTVYFQDSNGRDIAEDSFMVIGNLFDYTDGLKANYSWAMENDRFYEITNLADEVDISRYRVEISDISFE